MTALDCTHMQAALLNELEDVAVPIASPADNMPIETVLLPPLKHRPTAHTVLE